MPPVADPASRPPASSRRPVYLVASSLVLAVAVVVGAAAGSRFTITDRFGMFGDRQPSYPPGPTVTPAQPSGLAPPPPPPTGHSWLAWAWALGVVAVLLLAWWLWRRAAARRRPADALGGAAVVDAGDASADPAPVLRRGFETARQLLDTVTDPDDAVLRAWVALEDAAARTGAPRPPAATPTEFTVEVLAATDADGEAVHDLLRLYHRARFSPGGLGAADLEAARQCLRTLATSWSRFESALLQREDPSR